MIWIGQQGRCRWSSWKLQQIEQKKTPPDFLETPDEQPTICWVNQRDTEICKHIGKLTRGSHQTRKHGVLYWRYINIPVWHNPWIDALEVFVDRHVVVFKKPFLVVVSSYDRQTRHSLAKVRVYRRARHGVQTPQLSWRRNIEPLDVEESTKTNRKSWFRLHIT